MKLTRRSSRLAVLMVAVACGTTDAEPVDGPDPAATTLAGTVTLLGSDGPAGPLGVRVALYESPASLDEDVPAWVTPLQQLQEHPRRYEFRFADLAPGLYFVRACFAFGCGEYRDEASGELARVRVEARTTTTLDFGL